ncbi:MAG: AMP-binding protein [Bacteriovoracaceae bacterium]|nr:AMP-binding protein [Bacteriovoracaceae bacterium]
MEEFLAGKGNYYNILLPTVELQKHLESLKLKKHLFIKSSGTGSVEKVYALSLASLIENAKDVNALLHVTAIDRWMCPLTTYHIGGLSILIRAHLSSTPVDYYSKKWSPSAFYQELVTKKSTLLSLVPTQLFDLVTLGHRSPKDLRAVLIGGDSLPSELAIKAIKLGWPIYHTYGMTEFCSQIATSKYSKGSMELLSGFEVKEIEGRLAIKSSKMFTAITTYDGYDFTTLWSDQLCQDEFYLTQDRVKIHQNKIEIKGRVDKLIKLKGHFVDLEDVEKVLHNAMVKRELYHSAVLIIKKDIRLGSVPVILTLKETKDEVNKVQELITKKFPILSDILKVELVESRADLLLKRPYT